MRALLVAVQQQAEVPGSDLPIPAAAWDPARLYRIGLGLILDCPPPYFALTGTDFTFQVFFTVFVAL